MPSPRSRSILAPLTSRLAALALCAAAALLSARALADDPGPATVKEPAAKEPVSAKEAPAPAANEPPSAASLGLKEHRLDVHKFEIAASYSGPQTYYKLVEDPVEPFLRSTYHWPLETVTMGIETPEQLRQRTRRLRWKWRAMALPKGGDECRDGYGDSAASVYITWKRGLKFYALKYVWSAVGKKGQVCDQKRNLFVVQDTIIRQSGGPLGVWVSEDIDPDAEFRAHFEDGNPKADVPDFVGIGIMSDGDQTKSTSAADFAGFTILY